MEYTEINLSKGDLSLKLKDLNRAIQWITSAGEIDVTKERTKVAILEDQFAGCKELIYDCALLCYNRMLKTMKGGSEEYSFHDKLVSIGMSLNATFQNPSAESPIGLTSD